MSKTLTSQADKKPKEMKEKELFPKYGYPWETMNNSWLARDYLEMAFDFYVLIYYNSSNYLTS